MQSRMCHPVRGGDQSVPRGTLGFKHGRWVAEGNSEEMRGVNQRTQPRRLGGPWKKRHPGLVSEREQRALGERLAQAIRGGSEAESKGIQRANEKNDRFFILP
jgi:hypothetical protein